MAVNTVQDRWTLLEVLTRVADVFVLGALWLLGSLPVVTALASWSALIAVTARWKEGSCSSTWQTFWEHYRAVLGTGTRAQLMLLVPALVGLADLAFVSARGMTSLGSALVLVVGMVLLVGSCALGLQAAVTLSRPTAAGARALLREAGVRCLLHPLRALGPVPIALAALGLSLVLPLVIPFAVVAVGELTRRTAPLGG